MPRRPMAQPTLWSCSWERSSENGHIYQLFEQTQRYKNCCFIHIPMTGSRTIFRSWYFCALSSLVSVDWLKNGTDSQCAKRNLPQIHIYVPCQFLWGIGDVCYCRLAHMLLRLRKQTRIVFMWLLYHHSKEPELFNAIAKAHMLPPLCGN